ILRAHRGGLATATISQLRDDAVTGRNDGHNFGGEAEVCTQLGSALREEWLERVLRQKHTLAWAHVTHTRIQITDELPRHAAREGVALDDPAVLYELLRGALTNGRFQPNRAED